MAAAFGAAMMAAGEKNDVQGDDENLATDSVTQSCFKVGLFNTDEFLHDTRNFGATPTKKSAFFPPSIQRKRVAMYLFFEEPASSYAARIMAYGMAGLIAVSILAFMIDTDSDVRDDIARAFGNEKHFWSILEWICTGSFLAEYLLRLFCASVGYAPEGWSPPRDRQEVAERERAKANIVPWSFYFRWICMTPLNILDILAISPSFIELAMNDENGENGGGGAEILKVVRLIRVFRLFKLAKYNPGMRIMAEGMRRSLSALAMLVFFLAIAVVLFASVLHFCEKEFEEDSKVIVKVNGYESIFHSMWPTIVTMTTVGYGDVVPASLLGKIVSVLAMLTGILLVALPVAIVGSKFQEVYIEDEKRKKKEAAKSALKAKHSDSGRMKQEKQELANGLDRLRIMKKQFEEANKKLRSHCDDTIGIADSFLGVCEKFLDSNPHKFPPPEQIKKKKPKGATESRIKEGGEDAAA